VADLHLRHSRRLPSGQMLPRLHAPSMACVWAYIVSGAPQAPHDRSDPSATFADLPRSIQTQFTLRPLRVTTLNDKSDLEVRYKLFDRLNTGGIKLHPQEIRKIRRLWRSRCVMHPQRSPLTNVLIRIW